MSQAKNKWIFFLIIVLLISNVVLAFFLFASNNADKKKKRESPAMAVYKEIGLDSIQIDTFKARKDSFFKHMKPLWSEIRMLKDSLYKDMSLNANDSTIVSITQQIADKSMEADRKMYQHFVEIRSLCNPDQQVRFDTIIPKFLNNRNRRK
jgi:hypothetical protein